MSKETTKKKQQQQLKNLANETRKSKMVYLPSATLRHPIVFPI